MFESKYAELVREIHGEKIRPRPPLGRNPFLDPPRFTEPLISNRAERYVSPAVSGVVTFDYSNNNGMYVLGAGDMAFETAWSRAGNTAIHVYTGPPSIRTVALATGVKSIRDIADASIYDTSSRVRTPQIGEIVVWQNTAGYFAAVKIEKLKARSYGSEDDEITFSYAVQPNKTSSFRDISG
jgi:hypothetical protein